MAGHSCVWLGMAGLWLRNAVQWCWGYGCWGEAGEHLPLLADEKQEEHHKARDERQADPDDGSSVIAGPCREAWPFVATRRLPSLPTLH